MRHFVTAGIVLLALSAPALGAYLPIDFYNLDREAASALGIGYVPKACNFDLDDDLIFGEPEDCTICDDREGTTQILEDFDNDGEFEVQTYVDSNLGSNLPLCGGPETPCRTVTYAKDERFRPAEGENVFCVRGEFHEELVESSLHNGQPGVKVWPAQWMRERDWELPTNPTMIVGWDYDQDNDSPETAQVLPSTDSPRVPSMFSMK